MTMRPIVFQWTGEAMAPLRSFASECDAEFVIGERYRMEIVEDRSTSSHNHEFAWLKDAWQQLPEHLAPLYPSPEHLRKRALIEAGYYQEMAVDAGSHAAALRVAKGFHAMNEFCVAVVRGPLVFVRTPKSQSYRAMGKAEFQQSKDAIMGVISDLIGVAPKELRENAGRAA